MQDLTWRQVVGGVGEWGAYSLLQTESTMPLCCETVTGNVSFDSSMSPVKVLILRSHRQESVLPLARLRLRLCGT